MRPNAYVTQIKKLLLDCLIRGFIFASIIGTAICSVQPLLMPLMTYSERSIGADGIGSNTLMGSTAYAQPPNTVEQTRRGGFYWPLGKKQYKSSRCGTWLGRDADHGGCYFKGKYHLGFDMMATVVSPVYAISDGEVIGMSTDGEGNVAIFIKHKLTDGSEFVAVYGHIITNVNSGDPKEVKGGKQFATIGSYKGRDHLHFGIIPQVRIPSKRYAKDQNGKYLTDKSGERFAIGWGMASNVFWPDNGPPDTNGFIEPIGWITTKTPFSASGLTSAQPSAQLPSSVINAYNSSGGSSVFGAALPSNYTTPSRVASTGTSYKALELSRGGIYESSKGVFVVRGAVYEKYRTIGGPRHFLGLPISNEGDAAKSPQGTTGRFSRFERGTINWLSGKNKTYLVQGAIFDKWASMGYSGSPLGFPVSNEYPYQGGTKSDFEGGWITWTSKIGAQVNLKTDQVRTSPYGTLPRSSYIDGTLIRLKGSPEVYVIKDGEKCHIPDPETFNKYGYRWDKVIDVDQTEFNNYPTGAPVQSVKQQTAQKSSTTTTSSSIMEGSLIRLQGRPEVYVILGGKKCYIPDPETFNAKGYRWDRVKDINSDAFNKIPTGSPLPPVKTQTSITSSAVPAEGTLIRLQGRPEVYVIQGGRKCYIPDPETFNAKGYRWDQVKDLNSDAFNKITMGSPLASLKLPTPSLSEGSLIRQQGRPEVYVIQSGRKCYIPDVETFNARGYMWDRVRDIDQTSFNNIPTGPALASIKPTSPSFAEGSLVRLSGRPEVYVIQGGRKCYIPDPETFNTRGYRWDQVRDVDATTFNNIPTGTPLASVKPTAPPVSEGSLIRLRGTPDVYVIQSGRKCRIPDPETFNKRGYKWDQIKDVEPAVFNNIPTGTPLVSLR